LATRIAKANRLQGGETPLVGSGRNHPGADATLLMDKAGEVD
jgi:hypothetical protein